MKLASHELFATPRTWRIVTADLDLAHVFLPITGFSITPDQDATRNNMEGFRLSYNCQKPTPNCFEETFLVARGSSKPAFEDVLKRIRNVDRVLPEGILPAFDGTALTIDQYQAVSDVMGPFLQEEADPQRLEGVIKIPCHAHGVSIASKYVQGHSPLWIRTIIQVFQFPNVIKGDGPLLVIRAPLSPVCPMNNDGTATGVSH